jgi:Kef-type K+ transport system membrane component KefB
MLTSEQKKNNLRLGLILGSIALFFFVGFMIRLMFFGAAKPPARMAGSAAAISSASVPSKVAPASVAAPAK